MSKIQLRPGQIEAMVKSHPAAALLWYDIDAQLMLRLIYALDKSMEGATIVCKLLQLHQVQGGFDGWLKLSLDKIIKDIPANLFSRMTLNRTCTDLVAIGVIEAKPVVRNTVRQFRIVPDRLMALLANVDERCPGLIAVSSQAGLGVINRAKSLGSGDAMGSEK